MRSRTLSAQTGLLIAGLVLANVQALDAQLTPSHPLMQTDLKIRTVRDFGQPVLPIFEGWYPNEDGTYDLCFGYFSLNRIEVLDIPIGEDNFIEPARFNGVQPTHFVAQGPREFDPTRSAPGALRGTTGRSLQGKTCVFVVNVPADIGSERVWWNLRIDGQTYRVPGHISVRPYMVDNLTNSVGMAMEGDEENRVFGGDRTAPLVKFIVPSGPEGRGKGGVTAGPITTRVGTPLPLTISNALPSMTIGGQQRSQDDEISLSRQSLSWIKFSGPRGDVSFTAESSRIEVGMVPVEQTTEVTFSEPGDYVLLVQVLNGSFGNQCCWTNAYVNVTVTQ